MDLTDNEQRVIQEMRLLSRRVPEWRITVTSHPRTNGTYLQIEPTPYIKVKVSDKFELVD